MEYIASGFPEVTATDLWTGLFWIKPRHKRDKPKAPPLRLGGQTQALAHGRWRGGLLCYSTSRPTASLRSSQPKPKACQWKESWSERDVAATGSQQSTQARAREPQCLTLQWQREGKATDSSWARGRIHATCWMHEQEQPRLWLLPADLGVDKNLNMVWCNKSETVSEGKTHSPYHPAAVIRLISAIYVTNKMSKLPFGSPPFQMNDIGQLRRSLIRAVMQGSFQTSFRALHANWCLKHTHPAGRPTLAFHIQDGTPQTRGEACSEHRAGWVSAPC